MKKTAVFMVTILVLLSLTAVSLAQSSAYTPVEGKDFEVIAPEHTLTLTGNTEELLYNITYHFEVAPEGQPEIIQPEDILDDNKDLAVTGNPSFPEDLTYGPDDTFTDKSCTKNLTIDWSDVTIREPGIYRWKVLKSKTDDSPSAASDHNEETYLYVYATDKDGVLTVETVGFTTKNTLFPDDPSGKTNLEDEYPAAVVDLNLSKTVTGNQGSKDQYFKFTINLTAPAGAARKEYTITGLDKTVPKTPYNDEMTDINPDSVEVGSSMVTFEVWMKHGQTMLIDNLPFGTSYTITEDPQSYTITDIDINGDTDDAAANPQTATATDLALNKDTTVTYTNEKDGDVPTGISLESGASVMGLILGIALLALVFVPKRREENN